MSAPYFNNLLRKITVGFGNLFKDIQLVRYDTNGNEVERFLVPIQYAGKEKYVARLQGDPNLDRKIQVSLPSFSFELKSMRYDSTRKQNTNVKKFVNTSTGLKSQYNPVPYDIEFDLYAYVRNEEDGHQIVERILPFFTPDYTIKLNLIPEMNEIKEIPVILNSINYDGEYEGSFDTSTRIIIYTLSFTVKGYIYGNRTYTGLITRSITNIFDDSLASTTVAVNMNSGGLGNYQLGEIVYQGYSLGTAVATAQVIDWSNTHNVLTVTNIQGNFVVGNPTVGSKTNANYVFGSYQVLPQKLSTINITPNPPTANANSSYTYTTVITEQNNE